MRWPFSKPDTESQTSADDALRQAEQNLEMTKKRGDEVAEVVEHIRRYREENGFSIRFLNAMRRL